MVDLDQVKSVFIVGMKGVAMAHIAVILQKMGKKITGADVSEEFITDNELKKNNINILKGFSTNVLPSDSDLVIYSAAHGGADNPIVKTALNKNIPVVSQAAFLGELLRRFKKTIAVCGSHGKTTTTSLLAYTLIKLGMKPSYLAGSSSFEEFPGGDFQSSDYFVLEADEYAVDPPKDKTPKFNFFHPGIILCTNIDFDHPDVYGSIDEVKVAFEKFFKNGEYVHVCADDARLVEVADNSGVQFDSYGFSDESTLRIINHEVDEKGSRFDLLYKDSLIEDISIKLYGEKNISNAAGVFLTLLQLGFTSNAIKESMKDFTGPKRRFELVFEQDGSYLFDDYAHHPEEIKATITATRERFPTKKIIVIFQSHTYSRTKALEKEFVSSLAMADVALVTPIFPSAREKGEQFQLSSDKTEVIVCRSKDEVLKNLEKYFKQGNVIFTMGAGDIYKLKNDIMRIVKKHVQTT